AMRAGGVGAAVQALTCGLIVCACSSEHDREALPPVVVGMQETTAPIYDDGEQKIYQVTHEVRMPFRRPKDGERPQGDVDPYPDAPFQVASDTRTTVRFTLTNLDDKQHAVELLIDPWNEFVRYEPGLATVDDKVLPNFSGIQRIFILPPKSRTEGII